MDIEKEDLMPEIMWSYPKTIDKALEALQNKGAVPHGGGTGLLMGGLKKTALIDLKGLSLRFIEEESDHFKIGAMATYSDCAKYLPSGNVVAIALSKAASTPLRNRITVGGSIAMAPIWSDIIGPMVASSGKIKLAGNDARIPVEEYLRDSELRRNSLIEHVEVPKFDGIQYYHRETRTHFDYPMFTLSMVIDGESAKVVITGVKSKFARLESIEKAITGEISADEAIAKLDLDFPSKMQARANYLRKVAVTEILRGLEKIGGIR
ncbi:MAG TPA: hypothetical protein ENN75_00740 [candidate division Zixibacteria bacterium]|nr:hypothetical protein [candidate division Zixibacteria bacterium]